MLAEIGGTPPPRCSGTLISEFHVLTAGHCVDNFPDAGEVTGIRVLLDSDVDEGNNNYPLAGPNAIDAVEDGWAAHPNYRNAPFFVNDVGMIKLSQPVNLATYGELPEVNSLDALKTRGASRTRPSPWSGTGSSGSTLSSSNRPVPVIALIPN